LCGDGVAKTPFFTGEPALEATSPPSDPFRFLELRGVVRFGGETRVCFVDTVSNKAKWVTVGTGSEGLTADEYDAAQTAVLARSGESTKWFKLRETRVVPVPIAVLADGSVDAFHMSLTEKEKAEEARAMLGDLLEVARLGRAGKLGNGQSKRGPNISQPR
jgi:hypothetical protein